MSAWIPKWRMKELSKVYERPGLVPTAQKFAAPMRLAGVSLDQPSNELSSAVLDFLGMPNAAKVHSLGEGSVGTISDCSPDLFYTHNGEEERILFPKLLQIADAQKRDDIRTMVFNLLEDHASMSLWMGEQAFPPREMLETHGMIEDTLIWMFSRELAPDLFAELGGRVGNIFGDAYRAVADALTSPGTIEGTAAPGNGPTVARGYDEGVVDPEVGTVAESVEDSTGQLSLLPRYLGIVTKPYPNPLYPTTAEMQPFMYLHEQKFFDPWWANSGNTPASAGSLTELGDRGPLYLVTVPANGDARVKAMRAKINASWPEHSDTPVDPSSGTPTVISLGIRGLRASSDLTFQNIAQDLGNKYTNAIGQAQLATQLGVPVSKIVDTAEAVNAVFKDLGGDLGAELRPIFDSLIKLIGPQIMAGIRSAIDSVSGAGSAAGAAAGFSEALAMVPMIGATIAFVLKMKAEDEASAKEIEARNCTAQVTLLNRQLAAFQANRFPASWRTGNLSSTQKCGSGDPPVTGGYIQALEQWFWGFKRLNAFTYQSAVVKWWVMAQTFMTDDRVLRVFQSLTPYEDRHFGPLATDEQVMLVAAPFAVANGLDVDDFAVKLWNRCGGWSTIDQPGYLYVNQASGTIGDPAGAEYLVRNAFYAQFAVLAKEAIKLVEELKAWTDAGHTVSARCPGPLCIAREDGVGPLLSISLRPPTIQEITKAQAKKKLPKQLVLGALAAGALYYASLPLWIALSPFAIVYLIQRQERKVPLPPPPHPSADVLFRGLATTPGGIGARETSKFDKLELLTVAKK